MLKGLYKVDMSTVDGTRRGVVYCYDDRVLGGNSVFGFIGTPATGGGTARSSSRSQRSGTISIQISGRS